jgi:hypothetical protein
VITSGNVYFNNLHPIPVDKSHYEKLNDLSLLNELFSYYYQVRKMNDDMQTMTTGYSEIKNAMIQKHISMEDYKINTAILADTLKTHQMFMVELQQDTVKLLARIRVQIKGDTPFGTRLIRLFTRSKGDRIDGSEVEKEVEKLNAEIEETKSKSQKQIEEVLKKYGK